MNTLAIGLKRPHRKHVLTERLEVRAECPLCGHTAIFVFNGMEQEINCPDKYCPNCKDKPNE